LDVAFASIPQPLTIFGVIRVNDTGINDFYETEGGGIFKFGTDFQTKIGFFAGGSSNINGSLADTSNAEISSLLADGPNSQFRINGTLDASGNPGSDDLNGLTLGANTGGGSRNAGISVGELLIYPVDKSGIFSDVEQFLAAKWGITL